jgi:hypothetical protein
MVLTVVGDVQGGTASALVPRFPSLYGWIACTLLVLVAIGHKLVLGESCVDHSKPSRFDFPVSVRGERVWTGGRGFRLSLPFMLAW